MLYLSIPTANSTVSPQPPKEYPFISIGSFPPARIEEKTVALHDLFKQESEIEKRLPKLLHDYFKQTQPVNFSPSELVGLLNFEMNQVRQFALLKDAVVIRINPYNLSSDEGATSIAIKKELLANELKDEYKARGSTTLIAPPNYEIATQPLPGNTINPKEKMLALTFDDGPDGKTHALLDVLHKYEASATFFVLGQKVQGGVGILQRMIREGHEIGNHSWSHPDLRYVAPAELNRQIQETQTAIQNATGVIPKHMRPPYGATNPSVQAALHSHGLNQAMWSIDSNDWRNKDPELLYQRIMSGAGDGRIILLHDIHEASVQAAIRAIPDLKVEGYQLVTITQMGAYR